MKTSEARRAYQREYRKRNLEAIRANERRYDRESRVHNERYFERRRKSNKINKLRHPETTFRIALTSVIKDILEKKPQDEIFRLKVTVAETWRKRFLKFKKEKGVNNENGNTNTTRFEN